jgi:hypothetical protein
MGLINDWKDIAFLKKKADGIMADKPTIASGLTSYVVAAIVVGILGLIASSISAGVLGAIAGVTAIIMGVIGGVIALLIIDSGTKLMCKVLVLIGCV